MVNYNRGPSFKAVTEVYELKYSNTDVNEKLLETGRMPIACRPLCLEAKCN
jgi:hypothetical protein